MTSREPLSPDEQALAERLRGWSTGGPSSHLDDRILALSRAAIEPKRAVRRPWLVSLASAAALVLTVGVVWRVSESPRDGDVLFEAPAVPMSDAPVANEEHPSGRADADADAGIRPSDGTARLVEGEPRASTPATPMPQSEPSPGAAAEQSTAAQRHPSSRSVTASPTPVQPVMRARPSAPAPMAAPPPPPPAPAPQTTTVLPEPSPSVAAPYALPAAPAPVVAAAERPERDSRDDRTTGQSGGSARAGHAAESASRGDSEVAAREKTDARNRSLEDSVAGQTEGMDEGTIELSGDFAADVATIRALVVQARNVEAARSIAELRRRHPRKQIPADLLAIEREAGRHH